jgi:hypothetical protein
MSDKNDYGGLTAAQIRAARALLDWSQPKLVEASKLSLTTIRRMEGPIGPERSTAANVEAVRKTLEAEGIVFLDTGETKAGGPGVRLR